MMAAVAQLTYAAVPKSEVLFWMPPSVFRDEVGEISLRTFTVEATSRADPPLERLSDTEREKEIFQNMDVSVRCTCQEA